MLNFVTFCNVIVGSAHPFPLVYTQNNFTHQASLSLKLENRPSLDKYRSTKFIITELQQKKHFLAFKIGGD